MDRISKKPASKTPHLTSGHETKATGNSPKKTDSSISAKKTLQSAQNAKLNPIQARHIQEKRHVGHADQVILDKNNAKDLGIPPVVHLSNDEGLASGFAIHPRLVMTARHCVLRDSDFKIYSFAEEGIAVPDALNKNIQNFQHKSKAMSYWSKPTKVHVFGADSKRYTFDLKAYEAASSAEKEKMQNDFQKQLNVSPVRALLSTGSMPPVIDQIPDVAILEFDEDLQHIDTSTIPSLLDEKAISVTQSSKVAKRLIGFPADKLEAHMEKRQALKKTNPPKAQEMDICPLFASEAPKQIDFSPNIPQKIVGKITGKKNIHAKSFRGIASYGGNSGGPLVSTLNGKLYYTGVLNGSHPLGFDTTVSPLKGCIMSDLVLPTLHEVQAKNNEVLAKLNSLADIGVNESTLKRQESFMDWIKALLLKHLPTKLQDAIFIWRLEKAIKTKDAQALHQTFASIGLENPADWQTLKDKQGISFLEKWEDYLRAD